MILQIPDVLRADEIASVRAVLDAATWEDGGQTAGMGARSVKNNLQVNGRSETQTKLTAPVLDALWRSPMFRSASIPQRILGPMFNRYDTGMAYGEHVDNALMSVSQQPLGVSNVVRTDLAATLFLTDPADYEGGELVVRDTFGAPAIKLPAGHMILYPASSRHLVRPVTRGSRVSAVFWVQSVVRDPAHRQMLLDLDLAISSLRQKGQAQQELELLSGVYNGMLRTWSEP